MIKINVDEIKKFFKPIGYLLQKDSVLALRSSVNTIQLSIDFLDANITIKMPLSNDADNVLPAMAVNALDFWRIIKIMNGTIDIKIEANTLCLESYDNKYIINLISNHETNFGLIVSTKSTYGQIDNDLFKVLLKHTDEKSDNYIKYIYCDSSYWYATDHYNAVRFPVDIKYDSSLILNGLYARMISDIRENLILNITTDDKIFLSNSNYNITLLNYIKDTEINNAFQILPGLFNVEYNYIASFDSKDIISKYNNLKSVIGSSDFENGILMTVSEDNGKISAITSTKEGEENIQFNNVHNDIQLSIDFETINKVLYCCGDNIVSISEKKLNDNSSDNKSNQFCILYDDIEQIFVADFVYV